MSLKPRSTLTDDFDDPATVMVVPDRKSLDQLDLDEVPVMKDKVPSSRVPTKPTTALDRALANAKTGAGGSVKALFGQKPQASRMGSKGKAMPPKPPAFSKTADAPDNSPVAAGHGAGKSERKSENAKGWRIDGRDMFDDPLLECLYEMTRLFGKPISREALTSGLPLDNDRMTPRLFVRAANRSGFVSRVVKHAIDRRLAPLCPVIALLSDERAVIITEVDRAEGTAKVVYPQAPGEFVSFNLGDLEAQSSGYVITIRNKYKFDERAPEQRHAVDKHWFWGSLFKPWRTYRDVLVASLLLNLFALAVPLFSMNVYDRVIPNSAYETLWTFSIGVGAVLGFDLLMKVMRASFIDRAGKQVDHEMSSLIMAKVLDLRLENRPSSVGSFAANLRAFESVREFLTSASMGMVVDLPFAILFLGVIAVIGGWLALPPALAFVGVILISLLAQHRMKPLTDSTQRANQQRHATLIEALVGIETIKSLNLEGRTQKRWEENGMFLAKVSATLKLWSSIAVNSTAFISQLTTVAMVVMGVYLIGDNAITMGALIACSQLSGRALAPLGQISTLLVQYDNTRSSFETVNKIMDMPQERPTGVTFAMRRRLKGAVQFENVSFKYPNADLTALENVSFSINAGERVALIGKVGSGKSTIEKLLLGLYQPTQGTVRFDGIEGKQIDPAEIRAAMGYVPQDATLFFGSLRENISIGAPWADDTTILKAASLAGLRAYIQRHPQGLNLPIGERGEWLSGGQRQAVALARSLVNEPSMLLLDEPTSAMDSESEMRVIENLKTFSAGRTMIVVTHRMSLLALVDRVIVVDQGRIVADGPRDKVLQALRGGAGK